MCVCMCVCVHAFVHARVCGVFLVYFIFFNRNPILYSDLIYCFTSSGREFHHYCKIAHKYSEEVIIKRRKELLEVLYY